MKLFRFKANKISYANTAPVKKVGNLRRTRKNSMTFRYDNIKVMAGTEVKIAVLHCFMGEKTH